MSSKQTKNNFPWYTAYLLLITLAILGFAALSGLSEALSNAYAAQNSQGYLTYTILIVAIFLLTLAGIIFLFIRGNRSTYRAFRGWRNSSGHYMKKEKWQVNREAQYASGIEQARLFRQLLLNNEVLPSIKVWEINPVQDEVFIADQTVSYSRHYGAEVQYSQSTVAAGTGPFLLLTLLASGVANASARKRAAMLAASQWRDFQNVRCLISTHRILCNVADVGWLSFWYSGINVFYPNPEQHELTLEFGDGVAALKLQGPHINVASVLTIASTQGVEGLQRHPEIAKL